MVVRVLEVFAGKAKVIDGEGRLRLVPVAWLEAAAAPDAARESTLCTPLPLLWTPGEAARHFHVTPKTIGRWVTSGRLTAVWTLGGHRRIVPPAA